MRTHFIVPALALLVAGPALAQTGPHSPAPGLNMPGSNSARDNDLWEGAVRSSQPGYAEPGIFSGRSAVAEPPPEGPFAEEPVGASEDLPPNRSLPGSDAEQRDDDIWSGGN